MAHTKTKHAAPGLPMCGPSHVVPHDSTTPARAQCCLFCLFLDRVPHTTMAHARLCGPCAFLSFRPRATHGSRVTVRKREGTPRCERQRRENQNTEQTKRATSQKSKTKKAKHTAPGQSQLNFSNRMGSGDPGLYGRVCVATIAIGIYRHHPIAEQPSQAGSGRGEL